MSGFLFFRNGISSSLGDHFSILCGLNAFPAFTRLRIVRGGQMRQRKHIRNAPFAVSRSSLSRDANESQRLRLSDRGCNGAAMNSVLLEVQERHWQLAVLLACVR